jgi:hypothetical protein
VGSVMQVGDIRSTHKMLVHSHHQILVIKTDNTPLRSV